MKTLFWFCSEIKIGKAKKSSSVKILDSEDGAINAKDVLVPWVTIESKNDGSVARFNEFLLDLKLMSDRFKTKEVVLVPFAHLSCEIADQKTGFEILNSLCGFLKENGFNVKKANFGSPKDLFFYSPADERQVFFRQYPLPEFKQKK